MATFGPRESDISALLAQGLDSWFTQQITTTPSYHLPLLQTMANPDSRASRIDAWWDRSINAPDQLRQRVAFALSEIFVVSDQGSALNNQGQATAYYYDLLLRDAFGNFRTLLQDVSLSPQMGKFLSMLGNSSSSSTETRPDENYAREIMQLFSIGLVQLNADGSAVVSNGASVPTYTQDDVENLARALTGWTWAGATSITQKKGDWYSPMQALSGYHDTGSKTLIGGVVVPAGQTAEQDLKVALDTLFNHPNVGPFIGRQLIQRLVTSNPSPQYVARITAVFNDDGKGVRGNLQAVIKAVLTDTEALGGQSANANFGRLREPLLVYSHLWRAFNGTGVGGIYGFPAPDTVTGQAPLSAASVFNFFQPTYAPNGIIRDAGLLSPEFQVATQSVLTSMANDLYQRVYNCYVGVATPPSSGVMIDVSAYASQATDPASLIDRLATVLIGNPLPDAARTALINDLNATPLGSGSTLGYARVLDGIYLILTSPYYLIFR